jgi:hypothetical protein
MESPLHDDQPQPLKVQLTQEFSLINQDHSLCVLTPDDKKTLFIVQLFCWKW